MNKNENVTEAEIEKACLEFHKKIGKDKRVNISVLEGDTEDNEIWYVGEIRPEILKEILENCKTLKPKPFAKYAKGNGVLYSYITL